MAQIFKPPLSQVINELISHITRKLLYFDMKNAIMLYINIY